MYVIINGGLFDNHSFYNITQKFDDFLNITYNEHLYCDGDKSTDF